MNEALLTLDLGTSSCKGAVYDVTGALLAEASQGYPVQRPAPLWVEQDPQDWWDAAIAVCRRLLQDVPAGAIAGVGLSGQVPTMVLVDAAGQALAPAITWQDRRAEREAAWLRDEVGTEQLATWLGLDLPIDAGWPPARLLWWRRHQPAVLAAARHVLMTKDYLLARLTGAFCSDAWSAKGLAHLSTGAAPDAYYAALDVPAVIVPRILPPHAVAGTVQSAAAAATGLRPGTPVVTSSSDAICGMVGTGALRESGIAFNQTGTSEIIGCSGGAPTAGLLHVPAAIAGGIDVLYGPTQSGGDSVTWFAEWMGSGRVEDVFGAAAAAPAGAGGVLFLPYLQGERAPIWDSAARGALVGMRRQHGPDHGARAVLEGVAMSVRHVLEMCGVHPDPARALRVSGGSTRVELWNQIRADVTGLTVDITEQINVATLGAAMLAAVGAGLYPSVKEAATMARVRVSHAPRPERRALYDDLYAQYRALYPRLTPVFAALDAWSTST